MAENARNIPSSVHAWLRFDAQWNTPFSVSPSQILAAFSSFISPHFNELFSTLRCSVFYLIRAQCISSFNQIMALTITVLTTFLQLKYNQNSSSPFATHPRAMRVAVSSSVVYYLAYAALLRFPPRRFAAVADRCLVLLGNVSVASLASVLLPDSLSPLVFAVFGLLSAGELLCWLYRKLVAMEEDGVDAEFWGQRRRIRRFLNSVWRAVGSSSEQWPQILPVYMRQQSGF